MGLEFLAPEGVKDFLVEVKGVGLEFVPPDWLFG